MAKILRHGYRNMAQEMTADELKAAKKLSRQIAHRDRQNDLYANDTEYRERCKAYSKEYAARRRAIEKEQRQRMIASGDLVPRKPGRPALVREESHEVKKSGRPRLIALTPAT